jgi:hypothetical protein
VRVVADNGVAAMASTETRVEGVASVIMEVVDLDDPVEVGAETAYDVRIRNEGSIAAQNLSINCKLPDGVELISGKGPTDVVLEKGALRCKPLAQLPPGETVTYRIHVRGRQEGNLRFRASLTSDSMQKPLVIEEITQFYAD